MGSTLFGENISDRRGYSTEHLWNIAEKNFVVSNILGQIPRDIRLFIGSILLVSLETQVLGRGYRAPRMSKMRSFRKYEVHIYRDARPTHHDRVEGNEDLRPLKVEIQRVVPPVESQLVQGLLALRVLRTRYIAMPMSILLQQEM